MSLVETNRDRLLELYVPMFSQTPRVPYSTIIAMVEKALGATGPLAGTVS
ncbi:MAG TPA: hypothetical protein VHZ56_02380 [Devosia sp.]|nr:hypothetical protein [Devosia sp.]